MTVIAENSGLTGDIINFFTGTITLTSFGDTQFTVTKSGSSVIVNGSGFTYDSSGLTGGTITGVTMVYPSSDKSQSWNNFSVSAVAAWQALTGGNSATFTGLFFGGDDTFNITGRIDSAFGGNGIGGNDTYNLNSRASSGIMVDGGVGSDTVNFNAGFDGGAISSGPYASNPNFDFTSIETINLAAGYSYTLIPGTHTVPSGSTLTVNGSALGIGDMLVFSTFTNYAYTALGSLVLLGGAGDDYLEGGFGNDTLNGGGGSDTVSYMPLSANGTGVTVSLAISGPQSPGGNAGTDTLISIENLIGTPYNDTLTGDSGKNILDGAGGNDVLDGGAGNDTASFAHSTYSVNASLATGGSTGGGTTTFISIENLTGSPYDDTLEGDAGDNALDGGQGKDTVTYARATSGVTVDFTKASSQAIGGGMGNDTLVSIERVIGSSYNDTFVAGVNNAQIDGSGAYHPDGFFVGGAGFDTVDLSKLPGPAVWGATQDIEHIIGTNFADTLTAPFGDATLEGGDGNDRLSNGDPSFGGVNGADTMSGGTGDDVITLYSFDSADRVDGGSGNDKLIIAGLSSGASLTLTSAMVTDIETLQVNIGGTIKTDDAVVAAGTTMTVIGNGSLTFDGSSESDGYFVVKGGGFATLTGGQRDDILSAGLGTNRLDGGAGFDYVSYADAGGPVTVSLAVTGPQTTYTDPRYAGTNFATDTLVNIEGLVGSAYNDTLTGDGGDNKLQGGAGNDILDGGGGLDTAMFSGNLASYTVTTNGRVTTVSGPDGTDTLTRVERLSFADQTITLGVPSAAPNDFNGDGQSDILWQNTSYSYSEWLMSGAAITTSKDMGAVPSYWALQGTGDFTGDGKVEVLWHHAVTGAVEIDDLTSSGWSSQGTNGTIDSTSSPSAIGDFNGDGKADILWESKGHMYSEWLMGSSGVSSKVELGSVPAYWTMLGAGDFNGDGKAEVLWHHTQTGAIEIDGLGASGWNTIGTVGTLNGTWSVAAIGDFNGDGKADILWQNPDRSYSAWLMNGASVISKIDLGSVPAYWTVVGTGDFNGDGKSEVIWHHDNGTVETDDITSGWVNMGTVGSIDSSWSVAGNVGYRRTSAGDFNGDGRSDIVWKSPGNVFSQWTMSGATISAAQTIGEVPAYWSMVGSGDFNGDGKAEVLWHHTQTGAVEIDDIGASGWSSLGTIGTIDSSWSPSAVGDFNGDGKADILWQSPGHVYTEWQMGASGVDTSRTIGEVPSYWSMVGSGDFNSDGKAEVVWHHTVTGAVEFDDVGASGWTSLGTVGTIDPSWTVAAIGDFNADGNSDILWQSPDHAYSEWLMDGASVPSKLELGSVPAYWTIAGSGDFNGDGKTEVVWHHTNGTVEVDDIGASGWVNLGTVGSIDSAWTIASQTTVLAGR